MIGAEIHRRLFRKIAADAEHRFGPHVSLRRGWSRKGEKATGAVAKTVKHTPGFWNAMAAKAKAKGLTLHEAMRRLEPAGNIAMM